MGVTQGHLLDAQQLSLFIDVTEVLHFLKRTNHLPSASRESSEVVASNSDSKPSDAEGKAASRLRLAKTFISDGKLETAKNWLEKILEFIRKPKPPTSATASRKTEKVTPHPAPPHPTLSPSLKGERVG